MNMCIRNKMAFTLLEIVIVVFLISILIAGVLPSFSNFSFKSAESDAKTVASIIRYLNDTSQNTQSEGWMAINIDSKSLAYRIQGEEVTKEIDSLRSVEFSSLGEKESGEVKVRFSTSGLLGRLKVRLFDDDAFLDVLYNPYSRRVMIRKGEEKGIRS